MKIFLSLIFAGLFSLAPASAQSPQVRQLLLSQRPAPAAAGGSVTQDALGTALQMAFGGTSATYNGLTTTASANLIIAACNMRAGNSSDLLSVVWDVAGANQSFTRISEEPLDAGTAASLIVYGLVAPSSFGAKLITFNYNSSGAFVYGCAAASYVGANSTLANAVPSGSIVKGNSAGSAVASWNTGTSSDSFTVSAGHMSFLANKTDTGPSSSATWTPTASGSVSSSRFGYLSSAAGTVSLKITPDVSDLSAGIGLDISP